MPQIMSHQAESKIESNVPVEVVESWKRALAELIEIALNDKIRDCIRLYNPEKPSKDNKKALKACRKDSIIETLNFLSKATNEDMNKDIAIDKLCLKIKNFFPDICQICDQSYIVKYEDKPLLNCGSCGQEVHRLCYLKLLRSMKLINDNEEMSDLRCTKYLDCTIYAHPVRMKQSALPTISKTLTQSVLKLTLHQPRLIL